MAGVRPSSRLSRRAVLRGVLFGALTSTLPFAVRRAAARDLTVPYLHQYLGNPSDDHDCGPACVAMVLQAFGLRPAGLSNAGWVAQVRRAMGVPPSIGTVFADLQRACSAYGLHTSFVPSSLPGEPNAEMQMMRDALDAGNLVIALVHGATLGRGTAYGDHWVVVTGFTSDGQTHLLDPDDQPPRWSGWIRGGDIMLSTALFARACMEAQPGPYGLIISPPGGGLAVGASARIAGTDGDGAWLRSSPGIGDNKVRILPEGTAVTIVGPLPPPSADGHEWIGVRTADGTQGYVAAEYVSA
jgi:hypothetical protein